MNIDEEISKLEEQQSEISDKLDELYDIKNNENKLFRDNLVGKCFKDRTSYIKVLRRFDNDRSFEMFEFSKSFKRKDTQYENVFNDFTYGDIFVTDKSRFDDYEEITTYEYVKAFDELVSEIRNSIIDKK